MFLKWHGIVSDALRNATIYPIQLPFTAWELSIALDLFAFWTVSSRQDFFYRNLLWQRNIHALPDSKFEIPPNHRWLNECWLNGWDGKKSQIKTIGGLNFVSFKTRFYGQKLIELTNNIPEMIAFLVCTKLS